MGSSRKPSSEPFRTGELRREAEQRLVEKTPASREAPAETNLGDLVCQLQVRQIELEVQNEELLGAKLAAQEALDRYRTLIDSLDVGVALVDPDFNIVMANQKQAAIVRSTPTQLVGKKCFREFEGCETICPHCPGIQAMADGCPVEDERSGQRMDGEAFAVRLKASPIFDRDGRTVGFVEVVEDIRERKWQEQERRDTENRYRLLFENMLDGFAYCKMLFDDLGRPVDFVYLAVNSAFERLTGLKNVVGKRVTEVIPGIKEASPELFEAYGRVALTGKPEKLEVYLKSMSSWFSIAAYSTLKGYFIAVFDNVTERKRLQDEVALRERQLQSFFQGATAGLVLLDKDLRYVQINETLAEMNGLPVAEHLGRSIQEVMPEFAPIVEPTFRTVLATGQPVLNVEVSGKRPNDSGMPRHWIESFFPVLGPDGHLDGVGAMVVEITQRKRAEEALKESEKRFRSVIETSPDAIALLDLDGRILMTNRQAAQFFGFDSADELLSQVSNGFELFVPEDRQRGRDNVPS